MAEAGAVQEKEKEAGSEGFNEAEFERELAAEQAGEGSDEAEGTTEKDGTEKKPAGDKAGTAPAKAEAPAKTATGDQAAAEQQQAQDRAFLTSLGFNEAEAKEVTPKELDRLKRVHGTYSKTVRELEGKVKFYGESNHLTAQQNKDLKKTLKELQDQQTPADRAKGLISRIDTTKLSDGAKRILNDPEMMEVFGAILPGMAPAVTTGEPAQEQPVMSAEEQERTAAWAKEQATVLASQLEAAGHNDWKDVFASREFAEWFNGQPNDYRSLLLNPFNERMELESRRTVKVLQDYRLHRTAIEADRQAKEEAKLKNDGLRTHGGGAGVTQTDDDYKDPLDMTTAEFQAYEAKIAARRVRTG